MTTTETEFYIAHAHGNNGPAHVRIADAPWRHGDRVKTLCDREILEGGGFRTNRLDSIGCQPCRARMVEQRSTCVHCEKGIHRDHPAAPWTTPHGPGLQGVTDECYKAPNPDDGPCPGHTPGVIATKQA